MNKVQATCFSPDSLAYCPCFHALHSLTYSLSEGLEERVSSLQRLILNHSHCDKNCASYAFVKKALRDSQWENQMVEDRLTSESQRFSVNLVDTLPTLIEHAVLDSMPELSGSIEGLSEGTAIQFFLTMLHFFDPENKYPEVENLKRVLHDLFELLVYQEDHRYLRPDRLENSAELFHWKLTHLLRSLGSKTPYFFFPLSSCSHAMMGKVEWVLNEGYRLTIINSGDGAQFYDGETAADLIYLSLDEAEVLQAIESNLNINQSTADVYENVATSLPLEKLEPYIGRIHGVHKRNSCSVKSLSSAIHGVLPAGIYRAFKVFYTSRLIADMEPGIKRTAAHDILTKRTKKMVY